MPIIYFFIQFFPISVEICETSFATLQVIKVNSWKSCLALAAEQLFDNPLI
jgi:hypothetical protein